MRYRSLARNPASRYAGPSMRAGLTPNRREKASAAGPLTSAQSDHRLAAPAAVTVSGAAFAMPSARAILTSITPNPGRLSYRRVGGFRSLRRDRDRNPSAPRRCSFLALFVRFTTFIIISQSLASSRLSRFTPQRGALPRIPAPAQKSPSLARRPRLRGRSSGLRPRPQPCSDR